MQKVKVVFKKDACVGSSYVDCIDRETENSFKIIKCEAWNYNKRRYIFNKTSKDLHEVDIDDKIVIIPAENILYVEDLEV